jgi:hypothetical protein
MRDVGVALGCSNDAVNWPTSVMKPVWGVRISPSECQRPVGSSLIFRDVARDLRNCSLALAHPRAARMLSLRAQHGYAADGIRVAVRRSSRLHGLHSEG